MSTSTPRPHKLRRRLGTLAALGALVFGIAIAGLAGAQPANAAIWDFCKADQSFAAPLAAGSTLPNAPKAQTTAVGSPNATIPLAWVSAQGYTPGAAYQGGGMTWFTFGTSCADFSQNGTTMIANFLFSIFAEFPARILGLVVLLVFNFGTLITNLIIGDGTPQNLGLVGPVVSQMHQNIFVGYAPLFIALTMIVALWNVARRRVQKGVGDFGWLMGVIICMGILASPSGTALLRTVNEATQEATVCAVFAVSGACDQNGSMSSLKDLSNSMVETLDAPIWAAGALGTLANAPFADKNGNQLTQITFQAHDGAPNIHSDNRAGNGWQITVPIPADAIPASGAHRTFGDVWRWTQTYTSAEMAAMRDNPALACGRDNSPDVTALSKSSGTNMDLGSISGELCAYKWIVRAAVVSYIAQTYPASYGEMAGQGTMRVSAGMSGLGVLPLATGISIIGFMTLFYMLELIFLFLISPLVGLLSLRNPNVAKKWSGQIGAALVKRVAAGLVLGLILWMVGNLEAGILTLTTVGDGLTMVPPWVFPFITAIICFLSMIVGFIMLGKIRDMILGGMHLPEGDAGESFAKKAIGIGTAAASGALAAGSGLRLMGAGQALMRSGAVGGDAIRHGFTAGDRAGRSVKAGQARGVDEQKRVAAERKAQAEAQRAARREPPTLPGGVRVPPAAGRSRPGPERGAPAEAHEAWADLHQTAAARARRDEELRPHREARANAAADLRRAEEAMREFQAASDGLVQRRTADAVAGGEDPTLARKRAEESVADRAGELAASLQRARQTLGDADVHLQVAQQTPSDWSAAADAHLRAGSSFEQAAQALHLDGQDVAVWQRAADAVQPARAQDGPQS